MLKYANFILKSAYSQKIQFGNVEIQIQVSPGLPNIPRKTMGEQKGYMLPGASFRIEEMKAIYLAG